MENMLFELKEMKTNVYNAMIELDLKMTNAIVSYSTCDDVLLEMSEQMKKLVTVYKNLDNAIDLLEVGHE